MISGECIDEKYIYSDLTEWFQRFFLVYAYLQEMIQVLLRVFSRFFQAPTIDDLFG